MVAATTLLLLALARVPADAEVVAVAAWYGVDPAVALAVAEAETGNVPAAERDSVVSLGNAGRFQVNGTQTFKVLGYPDRATAMRALRTRHANIRAGVYLLRRWQDRFAAADGTCLCGAHAGNFTAHYNAGNLVLPGSRGERYGLRVAAKVRRMRQGFNGRRW
jgi:soluble lytic murein transglycosylase-like protein